MRTITKAGILLAVVAASLTVVIGAGVSIGAAVHWVLPTVDFGLAIIIGLFSLFVTVAFLTSLVEVLVKFQGSVNDPSADQGDEWGEEDDEAHAEAIARQVADKLSKRVEFAYSPASGRRRK